MTSGPVRNTFEHRASSVRMVPREVRGGKGGLVGLVGLVERGDGGRIMKGKKVHILFLGMYTP